MSMTFFCHKDYCLNHLYTVQLRPSGWGCVVTIMNCQLWSMISTNETLLLVPSSLCVILSCFTVTVQFLCLNVILWTCATGISNKCLLTYLQLHNKFMGILPHPLNLLAAFVYRIIFYLTLTTSHRSKIPLWLIWSTCSAFFYLIFLFCLIGTWVFLNGTMLSMSD